jgi:hypothetical protein
MPKTIGALGEQFKREFTGSKRAKIDGEPCGTNPHRRDDFDRLPGEDAPDWLRTRVDLNYRDPSLAQANFDYCADLRRGRRLAN